MSERLLKPVNLPDGHYVGAWGGHELAWNYAGQQVYRETILGIRGINIAVTFQVIDGRVEEETIKTLRNGRD